MVRPVEGYMAEDGTFFPTEAECEIYEARLAVTSLVMENLEMSGLNLDETAVVGYTELILVWVHDNFDKFERYVKAKNSMPVDVPDLNDPDELAPPATLSDDPNDIPF